jgi:predicted NAD/FAD-dependent oxidoreductase
MNSTPPISTVIVGAGLCGLTIASALQNKQGTLVSVVEKSKGVGGRMATRRSDGGSFDHGAQFYSLKAPLASQHERWLDAQLVRFWFNNQELGDTQSVERFCALRGMTALAKNLAQNIDVKLDHKLIKIEPQTDGFHLYLENGMSLKCNRLILTCPVPQSLDLLNHSAIPYDANLNQIRYAKALVGLFEETVNSQSLSAPAGYLENPPHSDIFSLADQSRKGLSAQKNWTITMNPKFSEDFFDAPEAETLAKITVAVQQLDPSFRFKSVQLKKWRYSHPLTIYKESFSEVTKNLFLAGDAFGGPSLNGAAKSAAALLSFLQATIP